MRSLRRLVALVAVAGLLAACSSEAALPGQVVATIGPVGGAATVAPSTAAAASTEAGPGASPAPPGATTAPGTTSEPPAPTEAPTPTETPTPTPKPTPKPYTGKVNLVGKVATRPPCTPVVSGAEVTSLLNNNQRTWECYAIDLTLGQTLTVDGEDTRATQAQLFYSETDIASSGPVQWCAFGYNCPLVFQTAADGTFYVRIECVNYPDTCPYTVRFTVR
jgi:hypothetical protein